QLDFPVVTGGEMDGQADYVDAKSQHKPASNLKVSLVAPDGTVEKTVTAAYDGYYSISSIRPGVYYLTARTDDPDAVNAAFVPQLLVFKPAGTTFFGHGLSLRPGYGVPFVFSSENPAPNGTRHTRVIRPDDIASQKVLLRLGQYQSRLGLTFTWYRFKIRSKWGSAFSLVGALADIKPDPKTHAMSLIIKPNRPLSLEDAANVCQLLKKNRFPCAVKVITTYRAPYLTATLPSHSG
ncbi:MAG: carboxypeptidase regulatory-like domain-containing protein, partial [Alphaproteobacteria bacterium]|nr:carboxypeptidase regulatory-like domain-containing protein [Alphaproteobacteria bacterium]